MANGKKIDKEAVAEITELARETYSFIGRFKRTKLIVALLFGGGLFALGLGTLDSAAEFAMDCFQLSAWIVGAYIAGQSIVDFAKELRNNS